jgi:hypothetical protein
MLCTQCAAVSFSAAAGVLVAHGERCSRCGAPLALDPGAPVSATARAAEADDDARPLGDATARSES